MQKSCNQIFINLFMQTHDIIVCFTRAARSVKRKTRYKKTLNL